MGNKEKYAKIVSHLSKLGDEHDAIEKLHRGLPTGEVKQALSDHLDFARLHRNEVRRFAKELSDSVGYRDDDAEAESRTTDLGDSPKIAGGDLIRKLAGKVQEVVGKDPNAFAKFVSMQRRAGLRQPGLPRGW